MTVAAVTRVVMILRVVTIVVVVDVTRILLVVLCRCENTTYCAFQPREHQSRLM